MQRVGKWKKCESIRCGKFPRNKWLGITNIKYEAFLIETITAQIKGNTSLVRLPNNEMQNETQNQRLEVGATVISVLRVLSQVALNDVNV